jgi:hypothetical protein
MWRWLAYTACVLLLACWGISGFWSLRCHFGARDPECGQCVSGFAVWLEDGTLWVHGPGNVHRLYSAEPWIQRNNHCRLGLDALPLIRGVAYYVNFAGRPYLLEPAVEWEVRLPFWCQFAVVAPAAALLAWRARRRRHRLSAGWCEKCGYDLRASPERCPECGTARAKATRLSTSGEAPDATENGATNG